MNIGMVCHNYPPAKFEGGISHYSRLLARALAERGHEIIVFTCSDFTLPASAGGAEPVAVYRLPGPWNHRTVAAIRDIAASRELDALVLQYSAASYGVAFRMAWAFSRPGCKKMTAFHSLWGGFRDKILCAFLLAGNHGIIATNSEIMHLLEKFTPKALCKTCWIPIASNIRPVAGETPPGNPDPPLVVYFGMLYPGKGLDTIIGVLVELKARGRAFRFLFIGGGMIEHESYEADFRKRLADRGLAEIAQHTGLIPEIEVSRLLQESRFVFLPYEAGLSDRRGSFMAAIAHGKAVLTSPPCVAMPHIRNGEHALWPERESVQSYANLYERLLDDTILNRAIGRQSELLHDQFDWESMAEAYELAIEGK